MSMCCYSRHEIWMKGRMERGIGRGGEFEGSTGICHICLIITPSTPCVETDSQDLLEELLSNLVHLIVEVPLL